MKKITMILMVAFVMVAFAPNNVFAGKRTEKSLITASKVADPVKAAALTSRLLEIQSIDLTDLSKMEKKALRVELRSINAYLNQFDGGALYISGGALLIIILLLILLL